MTSSFNDVRKLGADQSKLSLTAIAKINESFDHLEKVRPTLNAMEADEAYGTP